MQRDSNPPLIPRSSVYFPSPHLRARLAPLGFPVPLLPAALSSSLTSESTHSHLLHPICLIFVARSSRAARPSHGKLPPVRLPAPTPAVARSRPPTNPRARRVDRHLMMRTRDSCLTILPSGKTSVKSQPRQFHISRTSFLHHPLFFLVLKILPHLPPPQIGPTRGGMMSCGRSATILSMH